MERRGFVTSGRVPGVAGLTRGGATRSPAAASAAPEAGLRQSASP